MTAADTVLVCRPSQLREAGIVLSCFPNGEPDVLPPLLVLEPPPCTEAQYRDFYESYRSMRNLRDADTGTETARQETLARKAARAWSNEEIDRRLAALSPFRHWVKRYRLLARLLARLPLSHALFLFDASPEDISAVEPQPVDHLGDTRQPFLPEGIESSLLRPGDDLLQRAWRLLRSEPFPQRSFQSAPDAASVIAGLYRARRLSLPLELNSAADALRIVADPSPAEAVLVEAAETADASLLLAVHYVLRQRAVLCLIPPVNVAPIERARELVQTAEEQTAGTPANLPPPASLLEPLEEAVSALVPQEAAAAIAELPVTAFTTGVPYHFYKRGRFDWTSKPIGLIVGDTLLLLSHALFASPEAPEVSFNLLFDPGFFSTQETAGVMNQLRSSTAFPMLIKGNAATNIALSLLGPAPLDILYFNTHGSTSAVLLRDMPLPAYKLLQRVTLATHPLVFNNSCLSWTSAGREFISAGARAYIGTLWSVRADEAADYAVTVTRRIVRDRSPFAASMRNSGVSALTEKAYVFVGPVSAALRPLVANVEERARVIAAAGTLLRLGIHFTDSGPQPDSPLVQPVLQALDTATQSLCDEIDRRWPDPDISRLNLLTDQITFALKIGKTPASLPPLCKRGLEMCNTADPHSNSDLQIKAGFLQTCARVAKAVGRGKNALELLLPAVNGLEAAGENPGAGCLDISDLNLEMGDNDQALQFALRARKAFAEPGPQSARGRVLADGRLAQLWRKARKFDEAAAAAHDGYLAAIDLDDLSEQSRFRMDESRIHMELGNYPTAVTAADDALNLARRRRDEDLEVSALGTLTRALIFAQDWPRARSTADDGLKAARRRRMPSQIGDYLVDLSDIARGERNFKESIARLREAASSFASIRDTAKIGSMLRKTGQLLHDMDNWDAEQEIVRIIAIVIGSFERSDRASICSETVRSLLDRVRKDGWKKSRDYLWQTRRELEAAPGQLEQISFIRDLVIALHERSRGNSDEALEIAKRLDQLSANGFRIAELISATAN